MTLVLQQIEAEGDIVRGECAAIVEAGFRAQQEAIGEAVGRYSYRPRRQSVHGIGFVMRIAKHAGRPHQRREGEMDAKRAVAAQNEGVERVERLKVLVELSA